MTAFSTNTSFELWTSPFGDAFLYRVGAVQQSLFIVPPYIREEAVSRVIDCLRTNPRFSRLHIRVLTRWDRDAMSGGHSRPGALLALLEMGDKGGPRVEIRWLPNLHAKLYIFDGDSALVTSANLTSESLFGEVCSGDVEYGVLLKAPKAVTKVLTDIEALWRTAAPVSPEGLRRMGGAMDYG